MASRLQWWTLRQPILLSPGQHHVQRHVTALHAQCRSCPGRAHVQPLAKIGPWIDKIEEASDKRAVLFEKRTEEKLADIMRKKAW